MKNYLVFLAVVLSAGMLVGCKSKTTPFELKCRGIVCIKSVYATFHEDTNSIFVQFDVVSPEGKVEVGHDLSEYSIDTKITSALYLDDGDIYLWGAENISLTCYMGNDIPWADGKLAVVCSYLVPASETQVKVKVGDKLCIEAKYFDFTGNTTLRIEEE